jgi:hypothetical protein
MNTQLEARMVTHEQLARIEEHVRCRLPNRVRALQLVVRDHGLVLQGYVPTYYVKQLALHAVQETTDLPIRANEIEVR